MIGDIIDFVQVILDFIHAVISMGTELLLLCVIVSALRLIYVIKHLSIASNGDLGENPKAILTAKVGPVESTMGVKLGETAGRDRS